MSNGLSSTITFSHTFKLHRSSLRKTSGPVIKKSSLLAPFESSRTFLSTSPKVERISEVENDKVCTWLGRRLTPY